MQGRGGTGQTDSGAKSNLGRLWTCLGSTLEAVEQIKHVMQEKGIEREELHECMV